MSVENIDIYRAAQIVINCHGDAALLESMKKEQMLSLRGDLEGARVWHKISEAIQWMQMPADLMGDTLQ